MDGRSNCVRMHTRFRVKTAVKGFYKRLRSQGEIQTPLVDCDMKTFLYSNISLIALMART